MIKNEKDSVYLITHSYGEVIDGITYDEESAKFAKADDDINVITLGGDYIDTNEAICIIRNWLGTEFKGGRYEERLKMIDEIEDKNMK